MIPVSEFYLFFLLAKKKNSIYFSEGFWIRIADFPGPRLDRARYHFASPKLQGSMPSVRARSSNNRKEAARHAGKSVASTGNSTSWHGGGPETRAECPPLLPFPALLACCELALKTARQPTTIPAPGRRKYMGSIVTKIRAARSPLSQQHGKIHCANQYRARRRAYTCSRPGSRMAWLAAATATPAYASCPRARARLGPTPGIPRHACDPEQNYPSKDRGNS